ncbi:MAG: hypothetical protein FWE44_06365 [Defluviitaleaceae bacterium]|nr:hypothetical protein [Defluviitaleaceae bacterium]
MAIIIVSVFGVLAAAEPLVHAQSYVLIEADSGRVLSANNEHVRMFPAATTMIMTAILAYEHLDMDAIYIAGQEITQVPFGAAINNHHAGDAILGINLIRGMIVGAGIDTSNIVVLHVARFVSGDADMGFAAAQTFFANLMNTRAAELGALNTRFINAHGFHHANHQTTAYDLAVIARHALSMPTLAGIFALPAWSGALAGTNNAAELPAHIAALNPNLTNRNWNSQNELLRAGTNFYAGANGLRTGFTNFAGETLVASAMQDGITLISVTMNSPVIDDAPTRWQDARNLFDYGFENFAMRTLTAGISQIYIENPRLGEDPFLEVYLAQPEFTRFLSQAELERVVAKVSWLDDAAFWQGDEYEDVNEGAWLVMPPIEQDQIIGHVAYILDGEVLETTAIHAAREVLPRTTASDIDHHRTWFINFFFSRSSIPYWISAISVGGLLTIAGIILRNKAREKKKHQKYKFRK